MNRLHIICGMCGSNEELSYEINDKAICDNDGVERPGVFIHCGNCASLTGLDDVIEEYKS